ncbi:RNA polymerase sigma factor [Caulobacter sp. KR2-114]|uniref:RNA polymerase sigma factor n=1 Tax=Caulobacter sp. KR2-114 TaxID=3400912 RepID=UPI003C077512
MMCEIDNDNTSLQGGGESEANRREMNCDRHGFKAVKLATKADACCVPVGIVTGAESDEVLCERLRAGDHRAFHALMARHSAMVGRLAMNILSDRGEAEDVVQEVFVSLWRNRGAVVLHSAKFSTWLYRVSINKAIDKRRSRRATPQPMEAIIAACDAMAADNVSSDQERAVDDADSARALKLEIARLPGNQATALRGFYFEGRDVASIAAGMGCSEQAVRALLKRGKQTLRERLSRQAKTTDHDSFGIQGHASAVRACRR